MKEKIVISASGSRKIISCDDILYFQAFSGRVCVHFMQAGREKILEYEGSLKEIEDRFADKGLVRIHKSCIISLDKIWEVGAGYVVLKGMENKTLPVGRVFEERLENAMGREDFTFLGR